MHTIKYHLKPIRGCFFFKENFCATLDDSKFVYWTVSDIKKWEIIFKIDKFYELKGKNKHYLCELL